MYNLLFYIVAVDWWKQHEKSLVKEMLNGRTLNILNSESVPDLVTTDTLPQYDFAVDKLLSSHSNLLKDFQVISHLCDISFYLFKTEIKYV